VSGGEGSFGEGGRVETREVDALRDYVIAAIREMTRTELEELQLPASLLLRVKR
jgi:hypothetical protein